ncbi:hypothetical protein MMC31_001618 [Peltigera leucophlebia]|nr:hypothetical protein [Peltigera leucophlebia]
MLANGLRDGKGDKGEKTWKESVWLDKQNPYVGLPDPDGLANGLDTDGLLTTPKLRNLYFVSPRSD